MLKSSERFQLLGQQFGSLVERLNDSPSFEERTKLLQRMKVLIVELDMLVMSSLKRDSTDSTRPPLPHQPTAES